MAMPGHVKQLDSDQRLFRAIYAADLAARGRSVEAARAFVGRLAGPECTATLAAPGLDRR